MKPAATPEALEQARELIRHSLKVGAPGLTETVREAVVRSIMLKLEGKVLAPLIADLQRQAEAINGLEKSVNGLEADLQRVTAERDEARRRLAGKGMPSGPSLWGRFPRTGVWHQITDGRHAEELVTEFERTYANAGWTDLTRVNPFDRRTALATATAEAASLRAEVAALKEALHQVKSWIDTDLPAGTSRAGSIHRVVTKALDRTALARAATAGEG